MLRPKKLRPQVLLGPLILELVDGGDGCSVVLFWMETLTPPRVKCH